MTPGHAGGELRRGWGWWADAFGTHRSHAYATLARACARDPGLAGAGRPLVVLATVRRAALQEQATDPWGGDVDAFGADVRALSDELAEARARNLVQFTEPLRMADLLPGLVLLTSRDPDRPLQVVELGSCAGLLLVPERYEIRYPTGVWSPVAAAVTLTSDLAVPPVLLDRDLPIVDRVGVDLAPVDPRDAGAWDHLRSFAWAGDPARESRLRDALSAVADCPPPVLRGDVTDVLPDVLAERVHPDVTTVVVDSALSGYLPGPQALRLGRLLDGFASRGPLALVSRGGRGWDDGPLPTGISVLHLTASWRLAYAQTDLLSERTRWVGS